MPRIFAITPRKRLRKGSQLKGSRGDTLGLDPGLCCKQAAKSGEQGLRSGVWGVLVSEQHHEEENCNSEIHDQVMSESMSD